MGSIKLAKLREDAPKAEVRVHLEAIREVVLALMPDCWDFVVLAVRAGHGEEHDSGLYVSQGCPGCLGHAAMHVGDRLIRHAIAAGEAGVALAPDRRGTPHVH